MAKPFTVIEPAPTPTGRPLIMPSSRERHPFTKLNPADVTDDGDGVDLLRLLKLVQDNAAQATTPYRTNPLLHGELHRKVSMTSGTKIEIRHGLGEPFANYWPVRAYAGSSGGFNAVEVANNGGRSPSQYLVLMPSVTGTYDLVITPG